MLLHHLRFDAERLDVKRCQTYARSRRLSTGISYLSSRRDFSANLRPGDVAYAGPRKLGGAASRCNVLTIAIAGSSFCTVQASLKERAMHLRLRIAFLVAAVVGLLSPFPFVSIARAAASSAQLATPAPSSRTARRQSEMENAHEMGGLVLIVGKPWHRSRGGERVWF